jgi:hypothetical protein
VIEEYQRNLHLKLTVQFVVERRKFNRQSHRGKRKYNKGTDRQKTQSHSNETHKPEF